MEHRLISLLQASTSIHHIRQIHALITRACPSLTHVFLRLLLKQSTIQYARQLTWKQDWKVRKLIDDHHSRTNLIVRTAILEMYVKCGAVDEARLEFDQMDHKDVVAWSAMIAGYAQNGRSNEASL
ncbi:hypothetical protein M5K25_023450 [Dendrobium thyrsiflorum]|uniref:Pentatricopeptide repeat-containing protein n=1 Tax=Dendrobium thyrsiflorum TaxID=117978 RepID=A0ABD0UF02_DENTH